MGALKQANGSAFDSQNRSNDTQPSSDKPWPKTQIQEETVLEPDSAGYMELSAEHTSYVGSAHWLSILRQVCTVAVA
jgi:hypothetical protein